MQQTRVRNLRARVDACEIKSSEDGCACDAVKAVAVIKDAKFQESLVSRDSSMIAKRTILPNAGWARKDAERMCGSGPIAFRSALG